MLNSIYGGDGYCGTRPPGPPRPWQLQGYAALPVLNAAALGPMAAR